MPLLFVPETPMKPTPTQSLFMTLICSTPIALLGSCQSTEPMRVSSVQPNAGDTPSFVHEPTDSYTTYTLHGFDVLVSDAAMKHPDTTTPAIQLLDEKLAQVIELTPEHTHHALRKTKFWIEHNNPGFPCACYHPSADWLGENGYNTDKERGIEISNTTHFVQWTHQAQPFMVLHELAHAFHNEVHGFANKQIRSCFEKAQKLGTYEAVEHVSGKTKRHYALNNDHEYFAELTESYFGTNDFEPFTIETLKAFDPDGYEMIEQMWGINKHTETTKQP